jgi:hypothetical protein
VTHRKHVRIAVVMGVGIITVLGGLLALSASERFLFTEYLRVEAYTPDNHASLSANVYRGTVHVANIHLQVGSPLPPSFDVPVQVSIWHTADTELDSVSLTLSGADYLDVYVEAPSASWPPYTFRRAEEGRGAVFQVEDLGLQGVGTVVIRFLLQNPSHHPSFDFEATCSLHTNAFLQLTRQEWWTYHEIPFPP